MTVVLVLIVTVLALAPSSFVRPAGWDKLYHALAFACLAFPLSLVRPKLAVWVFLGLMAYGGVIELIQPHFRHEAHWDDLLANGIGAAAGAMAARYLGSRLL